MNKIDKKNRINDIAQVILVGILFLLIVSCTKEQGNVPPLDTITTIRGSIEQGVPDTKTYFGDKDAGTKVRPMLWSKGDVIATFFGTNTVKCNYVLTTGEGSSNGIFSGVAPMGEFSTCYAIYPATSGVIINHSSGTPIISLSLPSVQKYVQGNIVDGVNPTVAYTTSGGNLEFKNLCGVLRLELKLESGVKRVLGILLSSENGKLSGGASVKMNYGSGVPIIEMDNSASNEVLLDFGSEGLEFNTTPKPFHIVLPPTAISSTNKLRVKIMTVDGETMERVIDKECNSIPRSNMVVMPPIECSFTSPVIPECQYIEDGVDYGKGVPVLLGVSLGYMVFAPVNCGYEPATEGSKGYPYGRLYQWGRKYGQGYKDGTFEDATFPTILDGPVDNSVGQDEDNKNVFYKNAVSPYDWCTSNDDKLWNSGTATAPIKTVNDPCPDGWRVPTRSELEALKVYKSLWTTYNSQKGRWFSGVTPYTVGMDKAVFFPAAGYCKNRDGIASSRGYGDFYWSSSTYNAISYVLYYGSIYLSNRANGCSVRCVKE